MDGIQVGSPVQRFLSSPAGPKLNIHSIPLRLHSPTFYGQKEEEEEDEEEERKQHVRENSLEEEDVMDEEDNTVKCLVCDKAFPDVYM